MSVDTVVVLCLLAFLAGVGVRAFFEKKQEEVRKASAPPPPAGMTGVLGRRGDVIAFGEFGREVSRRRFAGGDLPLTIHRQHGLDTPTIYHYQRTDDRARVHYYER